MASHPALDPRVLSFALCLLTAACAAGNPPAPSGAAGSGGAGTGGKSGAGGLAASSTAGTGGTGGDGGASSSSSADSSSSTGGAVCTAGCNACACPSVECTTCCVKKGLNDVCSPTKMCGCF